MMKLKVVNSNTRPELVRALEVRKKREATKAAKAKNQ
jgi:hypothetical protein